MAPPPSRKLLAIALYLTGSAGFASAGPTKPIVETAHRVEVTPEGSRAHLRVRREFRILQSQSESFRLELPPHAAVTGLRVRQFGRWIDAKLLPQEEAFSAFERAQSVPSNAVEGEEKARTEEKPPVAPVTTRVAPVLVDSLHNAISITLPPLKRKTLRLVVEYELLSASCYANDWHHIAYPFVRDEIDVDGPVSFVRPQIRGVPSLVSDDRMPEDSESFLQLACHNNAPKALVAKWPARIQPSSRQTLRVRASWDTMALPAGIGDDVKFGRIELETASKLSDPPRNAHVVFVLDASHSVRDPGLENQLAMVHGALEHIPDARVQLVLMRRSATALFGDFVPARAFRAAVRARRRELQAANGSNAEEALHLAASLLQGRTGPVRIIAMSDNQWRSSYTHESGTASLSNLPERSIVHWLSFDAERGSDDFSVEESDDDMHTLAHEHGGRGFFAHGVSRKRSRIAAAMEELIRPMAIKDLRIAGADRWSPGDISRSVTEGVGWREMFADSELPGILTLRGSVWSQPWEMSVEGSTTARVLGAHAIGDGIAAARLSRAHLALFSIAIHTLSDVTSFLARDPKGLYEPNPDGLGGGGIGQGFT